jgi:hypothetical protein
MKRKKGLNIFNISNRLAYTLIVILSIVLIGVGVYATGGNNPAIMGHTSGELDLSGGVNGNAVFNGNVGIGIANPLAKLHVVGTSILDFGAVASCHGSASSCDSYILNDAGCNGHNGCEMGCFGPSTCDIYYDSKAQCQANSGAGCYWKCTGVAMPCSSFGSSVACNAQTGCSWITIQRKLTSDVTGINISNLNTNYYCDITGLKCIQPNIPAIAVPYQNSGTSNGKNMRIGSFITCPEGSYLISVMIDDSPSGNGAQLQGTCKSLPVKNN